MMVLNMYKEKELTMLASEDRVKEVVHVGWTSNSQINFKCRKNVSQQ